MDRGLNQGKGRGSSAKSTGADRFVVWLTSALSDLSPRMPIRWFRTRGEGFGGAGSPVCGVRGGAPPDFTEMVFPGPFRLVFRSGRECARWRTQSGALGGVWGLWRGTQQRRAALRGRGFAGVRLLAG